MVSNFLVFIFMACYLIGSIPTAYIVGKIKHIDIRKVGSGNVGATNTARIIGKKWGVLVLGIDVLKGYSAIMLAKTLIGESQEDFHYILASGLMAVIGHIFPFWLKFKGGKGVATVFGIILALSPWQAIIAFFVFTGVLILSKIVSISSILSAMSLPVSFFLFFEYSENTMLFYFLLCLALIILIMHISNLRRIYSGKESKTSGFSR